jgi:hypothetical protein
MNLHPHSQQKRKQKWIFNPQCSCNLSAKKNSISLVGSRTTNICNFMKNLSQQENLKNEPSTQSKWAELYYTTRSSKSPKLQAAKKVNCHFFFIFCCVLKKEFAEKYEFLWEIQGKLCLWTLREGGRETEMKVTFSHIVYSRQSKYIFFFSVHTGIVASKKMCEGENILLNTQFPWQISHKYKKVSKYKKKKCCNIMRSCSQKQI